MLPLIYAVNRRGRNHRRRRARCPVLWVNRDLPLPIPAEGRGPMAQSLPDWRRRLSHRLEGPNRLRRLAPQSRFIGAHAIKQGRVKIGKAQETLGDGAGWSEPRAHGRGRRFSVAARRIDSSVRAAAFAMAIDPRGGRSRLTGPAGRVLPARGQSFTLQLKQPRFDRTGTTKAPEEACHPMNELELDHGSRINAADEDTLETFGRIERLRDC